MREQVPPSSRSFAKSLRSNATDAERKLWQLLRAGRLNGLKFKRQVPHAGYILDFVCFEARLVVEVDGGQHSGSKSDALRDAALAAEGFHVLRFWNPDVLSNVDGCATEIARVAHERLHQR